MRPIAISLSPNSQPDDIRIAKRSLINLIAGTPKGSLDETSMKISRFFPAHSAAVVSSGRRALYTLFLALGIKRGDEVILQAFTCIAVPAAITWTGATPVYADMNASTYNLNLQDVKKKITPQTRAIIVQHTFGLPGPTKELQELCQKHNLFLIEDCAHAIGAESTGTHAGTFGHAAITSFGRDKALSCVFGGAVISKDATLIAKIKAQEAALPLPPNWWVAQQLVHPIFFESIINNYFNHNIGKIGLVALQKMKLLSLAVDANEKKGKKPAHVSWRFSPHLLPLLNNQLNKLPQFIARRRQIASRYMHEFSHWPDQLPRIEKNTNPSYLRFPVKVNNARAVLAAARDKHMMLGDWYASPLAPTNIDPTDFSYTNGSCPVAESLTNKVINLPTYPTMSDDQVEKVITFARHVIFN